MDRALVNAQWFDIFPNAVLENLVAPASNHYPIVLSRNPVPRPQFHKRNFRYENAWQLEPGFKDFVTDSWNQRVDCPLIPRLNACAEDMTGWSRDHCRKLKIDIEECRRQLHNIQVNIFGEGHVQIVEIRKRMVRLLAQDDAFWRQSAKTHWYCDGDVIRSFFMPLLQQEKGQPYSLS